MNIKEQENQIRLFAIIVIAICMIIIIALDNRAQAQISDKIGHDKLQREYNYESRIKANKAFTLASAKDNLKTAKKNARKENKKNQRLAKVRAKNQQIAAINEN
jgi:hypothetical protein